MIPIVLKKDKKYFKVEIQEEVSKPDLCLVIGKNGLFINMKTDTYKITRPVDGEIKDLNEISELVTFQFPTISYKIYDMALAFLRKVYEDHKAEGAVLLVLDKSRDLGDQEYRIIVPKQKVTGSSVDYEVDFSELNENEFLAGSIHSHPDFGAFQSGTDHKDEFQFDGIHVTLGKINTDNPEIHSRVCIKGKSYEKITNGKLIETAPESKATIPPEWSSKVEKKIYAMGTVVGNGTGNFSTKNYQNYWKNKKTSKELFALMKPKAPINQKSDEHLKSIIS